MKVIFETLRNTKLQAEEQIRKLETKEQVELITKGVSDKQEQEVL